MPPFVPLPETQEGDKKRRFSPWPQAEAAGSRRPAPRRCHGVACQEVGAPAAGRDPDPTQTPAAQPAPWAVGADLSALVMQLGHSLADMRMEGRTTKVDERSNVDGKDIQCLEKAKQAATVDTIEKLAAGLGVLSRDLFTFSDELPSETKDRIERLLSIVSDGDLKRIARVIEALVGG